MKKLLIVSIAEVPKSPASFARRPLAKLKRLLSIRVPLLARLLGFVGSKKGN